MTKRGDQIALPVEERYVSRSGVLQPNVAAVTRRVEEMMPDHVREERLIDRTTVNELENAVRAFQDRITDRERSVATLAPAVAEGEKRVAKLREDAANCAALVELRLPHSKDDLKHTQIKLKFAEDSLAALSSRLAISVRVLAATKQLSLEWYKVNGELLSKLRKLTHDSDRRSGSFGEKF